jgi:hypothetical protein
MLPDEIGPGPEWKITKGGNKKFKWKKKA